MLGLRVHGVAPGKKRGPRRGPCQASRKGRTPASRAGPRGLRAAGQGQGQGQGPRAAPMSHPFLGAEPSA
jgi:hypothetical protein